MKIFVLHFLNSLEQQDSVVSLPGIRNLILKMPVKAIPKLSVARNGIGAFVLPCHSVKINYCNWGGSSKGVREFLSNGQIDRVGNTKKSIFFEIAKRHGHPSIEFHYNNNTVKDIPVKNLSSSEVLNKINEYSQNSGADLFKWNHKVLSNNESVRGIWSPLHVSKDNRHKI